MSDLVDLATVQYQTVVALALSLRPSLRLWAVTSVVVVAPATIAVVVVRCNESNCYHYVGGYVKQTPKNTEHFIVVPTLEP